MPRVSISELNLEFEVNEGDVIFDALDDQGHQLPHGCLAGSCGACRIEVLEGAENLKEISEVEKNTIEAIKKNYQRLNGANSLDGKTIRLACRARILKGHVVIKPLK